MIGIHYERDNYNCAHFFADWYREKLGIEIPVINEFSLSFMRWLRHNFTESKNPVDHCLVYMVENKSAHVGVFYNHEVYHNYKPFRAKGSVVKWPLGVVKRNYKEVSYWVWSQ